MDLEDGWGWGWMDLGLLACFQRNPSGNDIGNWELFHARIVALVYHASPYWEANLN